MFSKKRHTLFISKHFIEVGTVILRREPVFLPGESLPYTPETLSEAFKQSNAQSYDNLRIVLGEELVYVTGLSFPGGTTITRELVREKAEESIPEDLRTTEWDFRTMQYAKKYENNKEILVQVAVVEGEFFRDLEKALVSQPLSIESIVPESYVLAILEESQGGVSVIVERDREMTVLTAIENGFVIATNVKPGEIDVKNLETFLRYIQEQKSKEVKRVIFSHFSEEERISFNEVTLNRECFVKDYNPLVGGALQEKVSGKDDEVLNLNTFQSVKKRFLWKNIFGEKSH